MASITWLFLFVVLSACPFSLVAAGGLFGNDGAEVESDNNRLQRPEDVLAESGKMWIVTFSGVNKKNINLPNPEASTLLNGSVSLFFTKEKDEQVRSRKNIVHFSTGETGYWRVARGMGASRLLPKTDRNTATEEAKKSIVIKRYEDAVLENPSTEILEIEILSNRPSKRTRHRYKRNASPVHPRSGGDSTQGPVLVYQIPVAFGRVQRGSLVNDVPGVVRLVSGEVAKNDIGDFSYSDHSDVMENKTQTVGYVNLRLMHGRGLVDPFWARGRQWFFHGRSKGNF